MHIPRTEEHIFENTIRKTENLLGDIEERLSLADKRQAYLVLRAVLHTVRDRLPVDDAVAFGAQLPMLVRGFYFEGWRPAGAPLKMNKSQFIGEVERQISPMSYEESTEELIREVMDSLETHMDSAEIQKIKHLMPKNIQEVLGP